MATASGEESLHKSTDCVYFLASPLTCKKGSECEFRHSETARINPRDCWYWLSGSCLNAHCPFRHPPLEGLSDGNSSAFQASVISRPRVPCYYFSQGYCAKGDKCIFMHGSPVTELPLKAPKLNVSKEDNNQIKLDGLKPAPLECIKGHNNGAFVLKAGLKSREWEVDEKVIDPAGLLSEGSDSSASAKPQILPDDTMNYKISRKGCVVNEAFRDTKPADDNFLHLQEIQAEDETLCGVQSLDENHLAQFAEEQNGTESEELWEESSFDVLVDDGADQLMYAEDMDFISSCDGIVDPLRAHIQAGMLGADGFAEYDYEHGGQYDQYYDATEYDLATYEAYEQQLAFDQLYMDGLQKDTGLKGTERNEILQKGRWRVGFDAEEFGVRSSDDLRNHIVKRRRAERSQSFEEGFDRRLHRGNGVRHGQRQHKDVNINVHNGQGRNHISVREFPERGDLHRNKRFRGRLGENSTVKRPYSGITADCEVMGINHDSSKNVDYLSNGKSTRGDAVSNRGINASPDRIKVRTKNDDVSFQGPKTLAQIKAEKMRAFKDGNSLQNQDSLGDDNKQLNVVPKYQSRHTRNVSPVPRNRSPVRGINNDLAPKEPNFKDGNSVQKHGTSGNAHKKSNSVARHQQSQQIRNASPHGGVTNEIDSKDSVKGLTPGDTTVKESGFEGPKPLSLILKEKRKEVTDTRQTQARPLGIERVKTIEDLDSKRSKDSKVGSSMNVRDDSDPVAILDGSQQKTRDLLHSSKTHSPITESDKRMDSSILDTDEKLDAGDSVLEDAELVDDDEDDDFAKKLGGFFT